MLRFQSLLILAFFLFAVVGRGFRPRVGENPFLGIQNVSEGASFSFGESALDDDECGPMKPFKAKRKAQAPHVQLPAVVVVVEQEFGISTSFNLAASQEPSSVRHTPELRPPINRS